MRPYGSLTVYFPLTLPIRVVEGQRRLLKSVVVMGGGGVALEEVQYADLQVSHHEGEWVGSSKLSTLLSLYPLLPNRSPDRGFPGSTCHRGRAMRRRTSPAMGLCMIGCAGEWTRGGIRARPT